MELGKQNIVLLLSFFRVWCLAVWRPELEHRGRWCGDRKGMSEFRCRCGGDNPRAVVGRWDVMDILLVSCYLPWMLEHNENERARKKCGFYVRALEPAVAPAVQGRRL